MTPRKLFTLMDCHIKANSVDEYEEKQTKKEERITLEELMAMKKLK